MILIDTNCKALEDCYYNKKNNKLRKKYLVACPRMHINL